MASFAIQFRSIAPPSGRMVAAFEGRFDALPDDPDEDELFTFAHLVNGYEVGQALLGGAAAEIAQRVWERHDEEGRISGSVPELLVTLFFAARSARHSYQPLNDTRNLRLYHAIVERLRADSDSWSFQYVEPVDGEGATVSMPPPAPRAAGEVRNAEPEASDAVGSNAEVATGDAASVSRNEHELHLELAPSATAAPAPRSYWVVPGWLLAGAYPSDVDAELAALRALRLWDAGIRTVIDLTEEGELSPTGARLEPYAPVLRELAARSGQRVRVVRLSIPDLGAPTVDGMRAILDAIDLSLEAGQPTYVHCNGGIGRSGTVIGCWLRRHGLATADDVLDVLTELRRADEARGRVPAPETQDQRALVLGWPG